MDLVYRGWDDGTSLYHYGIPGQKWGVRRYQNYDGSYTEEGLIRYGRGTGKRRSSKLERREEKRNKVIRGYQETVDNGTKIKDDVMRIINDLDINGIDSTEFNTQLVEYIDSNMQCYMNYGGYSNPGAWFETKEEAYEAYMQDLKSELLNKSKEIETASKNIEIIKNAKLTDRTFVENANLAAGASVTAGMLTTIGGCAVIGASIAFVPSVAIVGMIVGVPLSIYGGPAVTQKTYDTVSNIKVKKENRSYKNKKRANDYIDQVSAEYRARYNRDFPTISNEMKRNKI